MSGSDHTSGQRGIYVFSLLLTTIIWGTSFPAIKIVTSFIDPVTYTWVRGLIALLGLTPVLIHSLVRGSLGRRVVLGGSLTGLIFAAGLWLQGWGTSLTTASNAGFITGMNVVFVHLYDALVVKDKMYGRRAFTSLFLSLIGLYLLTSPEGLPGIGDMLVFISALLFAAQVELIGRFAKENPLLFTFFEMLPFLIFIVRDLAVGIPSSGIVTALPWLIYLGLICSDIALALQVFGQRRVRPYEAAILYLFEPVMAAIFSFVILGEVLNPVQYVGAALILGGMAVVTFKSDK